jgi:hypothetical protein
VDADGGPECLPPPCNIGCHAGVSLGWLADPQPRSGSPAELESPFDLGGGERDPVQVLENLVGRGGLAVNPDQVLPGLTVRHFPLEEGADCGSFLDLDVIRETAAVIVDKQNFHGMKTSLEMEIEIQ